MINKIKSLINEFRANDRKINSKLIDLENQGRELEWAHIYHDSIRGKKWLEELPLNVGRWAGNYSFFYVLNRILMDYKPKSILDLGLGESSKFISSYLDNYLLDTRHTIVEQNEEWINSFQEKVVLSNRSNIICCPLKQKEIKGHISNVYEDFANKVTDKFDLYIVDGPFGSDRYSRYDLVTIIETINSNDEFIILFDDTNRLGEQDTLNDIITILKNKNINIFIGYYEGNKANTVIATQKYKFAISL
jgi:hypothetical protein